MATKSKIPSAAAASARTRETPEVRRGMLIQATTRSIAKFGYSGTTIERICAEAGVSRGLINHHFGSKEQLILDTYQQVCDEWAYYFKDISDGATEPEDALRTLIEKNFNPIMFKPEYLSIWLGFWSVIPKTPELKKLDRALYSSDLKIFENLFEKLASKRKLKVNPRLEAIGLMSLMEGLWLQWCLDPKSFSVAEAREICLGAMAKFLN